VSSECNNKYFGSPCKIARTVHYRCRHKCTHIRVCVCVCVYAVQAFSEGDERQVGSACAGRKGGQGERGEEREEGITGCSFSAALSIPLFLSLPQFPPPSIPPSLPLLESLTAEVSYSGITPPKPTVRVKASEMSPTSASVVTSGPKKPVRSFCGRSTRLYSRAWCGRSFSRRLGAGSMLLLPSSPRSK
jgi:hypothetical protein